jgi:hypothetical protein
MLRPAVAATNWARAGNIGLDMRDGGSVLVLAVPGWDFGAKVPARTGAVNDGAGSRTIRPGSGRGCIVPRLVMAGAI